MSSRPSRLGRSLVGILILVAGTLCLNYTQGFDMDHHVEWAAQHDLPAPAYPVFVAGVILVAVGAGVVGHAFGRSARAAA